MRSFLTSLFIFLWINSSISISKDYYIDRFASTTQSSEITIHLNVTSVTDGIGLCPSESNCNFRTAWNYCVNDVQWSSLSYDSCEIHLPDSPLIINESYGEIQWDISDQRTMNIIVRGNLRSEVTTIARGFRFLSISSTDSASQCTFSFYNFNINGFTSNNFGTFHFSGPGITSVVFTEIHFFNLTAGHGGAVSLDSVKALTVHNSDFSNCSAGMEAGAGSGGAIHMVVDFELSKASTVTITNTSFRHNRARDNGGAISIDSVVTQIIKGCLFDSNVATSSVYGYGGAIAVFTKPCGGADPDTCPNTLTVLAEDSMFSGNRASRGGALYHFFDGQPFDSTGNTIVWTTLRVTSSQFLSNIALDMGGALYVQQYTTLSSMDCLYRDNSASFGGAVYSSFYNTIGMVDSHFISNTATQDGGGLYVYQRHTDGSSLLDCTFSSNVAGGMGGGAFLSAKNNRFDISSTSFDDNQAGLGGGGLVLQDFNYYLVVHNCSFSRNVAGEQGGAVVFLTHFYDVRFTDVTFRDNSAMLRGGAVAVSDSADTFLLDRCVFSGNRAGYLGGGLFLGLLNLNLVVTDSDFVDNFAEDGAGILVSHLNSHITVQSSTFLNNTATRSGGAVHISFLNTVILVSGSRFETNQATGSGGAVVITHSNQHVEIINNVFGKNTAGQTGGAIGFDVGNKELFLSNCTFLHNSAKDGGGVGMETQNIMYDETGGGMIHCIFTGNKAVSAGGAVFARLGNTLSLAYLRFTGNEVSGASAATGGGGLASVEGNILVMNSSLFVGNAVPTGSGGAMFLGGRHADTVLSNTIFRMNTAGVCGGGLGTSGSGITGLVLVSSSFISNTAMSGGALCLSGTTDVSIINCDVSGNTAVSGNGGAIVAEGARNLSVGYSHFIGNKAIAASGGALLVSSNSLTSITSSLFEGNVAYSGSAVYILRTDSPYDSNIISNNQFVNNSARGGGTVFWDLMTMTITTTSMYNTASTTSPTSGMPLMLDSNTWRGNTAGWGSRWATPPVSLTVLSEDSRRIVSFERTIGGTVLPRFTANVLDFYNQTVISQNESFVSVEAVPNVACDPFGYVSGQTIVKMVSGQPARAVFYGLFALCRPGQRMALELSATIGSSVVAQQAAVGFQRCSRGEFYSDSSGICVRCYNGTYSLQDNANSTIRKCTSCTSTEGVDRCFGSQIVVSPGYWRASSDAATLVQCPFGSRACIGGEVPGDRACAFGYEGPLCAVCADGFRLYSFGNECRSCTKKDPLVSLVVVLAVVVVLLGTWKLLDLGAEYFHLDVRDILVSPSSAAVATEVSSNATLFYRCGMFGISTFKFLIRLVRQFPLTSMEGKILYSTIQIFSNFTYMVQVTIEEPFRSFCSFFAWINFSFMDRVGLGCDFHWDYVSVLQVTTLVPIGIAVALAAGDLLSRASITRRGVVRNFNVDRVLGMSRAQYTSMFLLLTYLVLPGVSIVIFRSFTCVDADPDNVTGKYSKYLRADMSISCDSHRYRFGVIWAIISIFVYPVGIPTLYLWLLHRVRHRIREEALFKLEQESEGYTVRSQMAVQDAVKQLQFLYGAYRPLRWYWEVVETVRRILLTGVLAVLIAGSPAQIVIGMVITVVFIKIYSTYEPYANRYLQFFAEMCMYGEFLVLFGALIVKTSMLQDFYRNGTGVAVGMLCAAIIPFVVLVVMSYTKPPEEVREQKGQELVLFDLTEAEQRRVDTVMTKIVSSRGKNGVPPLTLAQLNSLIHAAALNATDESCETIAKAVREINAQREQSNSPSGVPAPVSLMDLWALSEVARSSVTTDEIRSLVSAVTRPKESRRRSTLIRRVIH
eukprot:gene1620-3135_t